MLLLVFCDVNLIIYMHALNKSRCSLFFNHTDCIRARLEQKKKSAVFFSNVAQSWFNCVFLDACFWDAQITNKQTSTDSILGISSFKKTNKKKKPCGYKCQLHGWKQDLSCDRCTVPLWNKKAFKCHFDSKAPAHDQFCIRRHHLET